MLYYLEDNMHRDHIMSSMYNVHVCGLHHSTARYIGCWVDLAPCDYLPGEEGMALT